MLSKKDQDRMFQFVNSFPEVNQIVVLAFMALAKARMDDKENTSSAILAYTDGESDASVYWYGDAKVILEMQNNIINKINKEMGH